MRRPEILLVVAAVLIVAGCALIFAPAGLIVAGLIIAGAVFASEF